MMTAFSLCSRIKSTQALILSSDIESVRLKIIVPACSIWFTKNSPKFLMNILHFFASTTATALFKVLPVSASTSLTAFITSDNLPTPDGSIRILSG